MTVFDRVKKLADKQKISIVELEEKLGFGRNSLYSWKKKTPNGESLNKVADYFDKSDLTVWTNVYGGPGEWDEYKEDSIVEVAQKATHVMAERDNTITMAQLKELCAGELNEQKNKPTS